MKTMHWGALLALLLLASCGGGDDASADPPLIGRVAMTKADISDCQSGKAGYALVDGQCLPTATSLQPPSTGAQPLRSAPVLTTDALFNWAEQHYPQYFGAGTGQGGVWSPYTYRYYRTTDTYLAVTTQGGVYVLGPWTGGQILYVGQMADFTCAVYPSACDVPGDTSTGASLAVGSSVTGTIDSAGDADWYAITLNAGWTYTFDLQGTASGQGTLSDPVLRVLDSAGAERASNDDSSGSSFDSHIVFPAPYTGRYYLSAQGYTPATGTPALGSYRLAAALTSTGGGGGGGGGGSNYITWTGSANGTVILDAANNQFAVDASTGAVVALATTTTLTGLIVDSSANLLLNNSIIGGVYSAQSTTGSTIVVFNCSDGSGMTISVGATYTSTCGSGGGGGGGGGGGSGNTGSFSTNETSEITATLTGSRPNYVSSSGLTLAATTPVWAFTWAEYSASFWAVDTTNANRLMSGSTFSGYPLGSAGQTGLLYATLPPGTWYVAVIPNQTIDASYSNRIYAELSVPTLSGANEVSNVPFRTGVVQPGGWITQPFTITSGSGRAFIETEGDGGTFAVMTAAQANSFVSAYSNGFFGGTYSYTYACGASSGSPATEIECELQLPPGSYSIVYFNTTSSPSGGAANIGFFQ